MLVLKLVKANGFGIAILLCAAISFAFPSAFTEWGGVKLTALVVPAIQIIMSGMGTTRWTRGFDRMHFFDQGVKVTPEGLVDEIQKRLTDGHDHVIQSHMWRSSLPGGREEYFAKTERFVQLLADRQIPTRTMPELLNVRFGMR